MPMADTYDNHGRSIRALIYGRDKTKKTFWAASAANFGYNVILLDGDDGSSIVTQLPLEARKKILVVNLVNTRQRAVFSLFMASFCRPGNEFLWDENDKCSLPKTMKMNPEHSYIRFDPAKLTNNDVVIIDSWTALAASTLLQFAAEMNMDLTAVEKERDQFAHLNFQARFLDYVLNQIHTLPCHVIVVGHEQEWEKFKGQGQDRKLVGTFTQPISSTGPHGSKLGKHFSEVLHFSKLSDLAYRINTGGDQNKAGGSRLLAPKLYDWKDVTPQLLFDAVGSKATGDPCHGAIYCAPGQSIPELAKSNTTNSQVVSMVKQSANPQATETVPAQTPVVNAGVAASKISLLSKLKPK